MLRAHDPATLGIARYRNGAWEVIPSRLEGKVLSADITESGTYAVVARIPGTTPTGEPQPWRLGWESSFLLAVGALGAAAIIRDRSRRNGGM
jgi:hypothetical protein